MKRTVGIAVGIALSVASGCASKYKRDLNVIVARTDDPLVSEDHFVTMNLDRSQVWKVEDGIIHVDVADLYDRLSGADFWFEVYSSQDTNQNIVFRSDTLNVRQVRKWALQPDDPYEVHVYEPSPIWLRQVERGRSRVFKDEKAVTE